MEDRSAGEGETRSLSRRQVTALSVGGVSLGVGSWLVRPPPERLSDSWETRASLPNARGEMKGAVLDGEIYVPGGMSGLGSSTTGVTAYDPETDEWSSIESLPTPLNHHATAALDGTLYVAGGNEAFTDPAGEFAFAYHPQDDIWEELPPLPDGRWGHEMVSFGDLLYVVGGITDADTEIDTLVYDPDDESWERLAPIPTKREHVAATALDDRILVIGGRWDDDNTAAVEAYEPDADSWRELPSLDVARSGFGATTLDGTVHAIGGENPSTIGGWTTGTHEQYDLEGNTWEQLSDAPLHVHGNVVVSVGNHVYVIGGAWRQGLWSVTSWSDRTYVFEQGEEN